MEVFCLTCHDRAAYQRAEPHKRELAKGSQRRACTRCHGDHVLEDTTAAGKPRAP
jgi:hypothetical protein